MSKVPPRTWLILDGSPIFGEDELLRGTTSVWASSTIEGETEADAGDDVAVLSESCGGGEAILSSSAGGGAILATAGAPLLRLVPKERLHGTPTLPQPKRFHYMEWRSHLLGWRASLLGVPSFRPIGTPIK